MFAQAVFGGFGAAPTLLPQTPQAKILVVVFGFLPDIFNKIKLENQKEMLKSLKKNLRVYKA